jgi:predicted kinase
MGAVILDLDVVTGPLTEVVADLSGSADLSDPRLASLTRSARYTTLLAVAEANVRAGRSVVLVAPFSTERHDRDRWDFVRGQLQAAGADVTLVWLSLPAAELIARLRNRSAVRDTAKIADPQAYVAGLDRSAPVGQHVALDGTRPAPEMVALIEQHLRS